MTPVELSRTVLSAVRRAVDVGELSVGVPERVVVTPPRPGGCGDYATNIALRLARSAGQPAPVVAQVLRGHLLGIDGIDDVTVTGPGFLNISLRDADAEAALVRLVEDVRRSGERYGYAPPATGAPETTGTPRSRVTGTPRSRATGSPQSTPTVVELCCPREVRAVVVADVVARLLRSQGGEGRVVCAGPVPADWERVLGVHVDAPGHVDASGEDTPHGLRAPVRVRVRPVPAPADPLPLGRDAARWALLHPAGHDRPRIGHDRPRIGDGQDEYGGHDGPGGHDERCTPGGHDGPDGHDERCTPGGHDERCTPGGHDGPDGHDERCTPGRHDALDRHLVQRESNPLFRVRYAHARTRALGRNAADLGFGAEAGPVDVAPPELLTLLADHPRVLARAADHRAPDVLARHLVSVADAVLPFLATVLPRGEEKPSAAHRARLALAEAAGTVLAGGLSLLGIDAPEHL
ncbi:ArgS-related anticodon-binding protein NrtL [Streptomyces cyslabdanicus]|uniref:ArgS-related anticodon-binding protein NrtL n=1 Tax=Streptomyces cyslabdanicus TaxID=1470456 RepID=UPI0040447166